MTRGSAPGRSGLDRREGNLRRISDAPSRPPLPAPRLETLIRHPSISGQDERTIIMIGSKSRIPRNIFSPGPKDNIFTILKPGP